MAGSRRGIGRTEIIVGVAVVAVLVLIAVPLVMGMSSKSSRTEVPMVVDAIREAEIKYHREFGDYVSAESTPRKPHEVNATPVPWASNRGFDTIGLVLPNGISEVYGSYKVTASKDGFVVVGTCDIDNDGARAVYEASDKDGDVAHATSPSDVY
jgi:Tfp pilus assembly protein PilE